MVTKAEWKRRAQAAEAALISQPFMRQAIMITIDPGEVPQAFHIVTLNPTTWTETYVQEAVIPPDGGAPVQRMVRLYLRLVR